VIQAHDPTWVAIKRHLDEELQKLRVKNDTQMPESETVALRARIAAVKDLLLLPTKLAATAAHTEPVA